MKKFLTVLLALSVVFTYSFSAVGTAFAATTDADEAKADLISYIDEVEAEGAKMIADNGVVEYSGTNGAWEVTAANWKLAYTKAYNDFVKLVTEATITATTSGEALNEVVTDLITGDAATADKETIKLAVKQYLAKAGVGQTYVNPTAVVPALKAQLAADKEAEVKKVDAVDTSIYSTKEYSKGTASTKYAWGVYAYEGKADDTPLAVELEKDTDKELYVAKEVAEKALAEVKVGLNVIATVGPTDDATRLEARHTAMSQLMTAYIVGTKDSLYETWTYTLKTGALDSKDPLTITKEKGDEETSEADILTKKAQINQNVVEFRNGSVYNAATATAKDKAEYDKYLAAYKTAETYMVENDATHDVSDIKVTDVSATAALIKKVNVAAAAIEEAAELKVEKNTDGSAKYDAETIDENLKIILLDLYDVTDSKDSYTTADLSGGAITYVSNAEKANYKAALKNIVDTANMTVDYKLEDGFIEENETEDPVAYYDLEWASVEKAVDAYYAAVDAAKTVSDVKDAATAFNKAMGKIADQKAVKSVYNGLKTTTLNNEFAKLNLDAQKLNLGKTGEDKLVFAIVDFNATSPVLLETYADGTLLKFYIDNNARTAAEITALYSKAAALLGDAKTIAALQAEAKKVKDMIAALPAEKDIKVADKAQIEAAYDAYEALPADYQKYVTNATTLNDAIDAVKDDEGKEIQKAKRELPLLSAVTIADKAAVQKVADMIAAYAGTLMYEDSNFTDSDVDNLLDTIRDLEFAAVKKAAKAVPEAINVTLADKVAIEAARRAYDAYVAEYGDDLNSNELAALKDAEKKIVEAEKALTGILAKEKDAQIKAVESFKIKVTTKRYTGSKMRINWTATGDESAIDGYRIYYSTKKSNSGYKYLAKTTKKYINHTSIKKSVKKGTRVYYRVRAYVEIDGVRYFSDYSTVGNRIWK